MKTWRQEKVFNERDLEVKSQKAGLHLEGKVECMRKKRELVVSVVPEKVGRESI